MSADKMPETFNRSYKNGNTQKTMNMKRIIIAAAAAVICISANTAAYAQSLKDILNSSAVRDVITSATGITLPTDITGTWDYSGTAVKFEGDNVLKNATAALAATELEKKLNTYTEKIGLKEGTFSYTFNADSTFTTSFKGKPFSGKYSLSPDRKRLALNYGKALNLLKMNAIISVNGDQTDIMFKADKLLEFIGKISSSSNNATLKSISAVAGQYNGMDMGFAVKKKK